MRRTTVLSGAGGLTGFSIGTRWLSARAEWAFEWITAASDSTVLAVLFAAIAERGAVLYALSLSAQLVLYAVGVYLLWPRLLRGRGREMVDSRRIRVVLTALVLLVLAYVVSRGQAIGGRLDLVAAIVLVGVVPCVVGLALVRSRPKPYDPERGSVVRVSTLVATGRPKRRSALMDAFDPSNRRSVLTYTYLAGLVLTAIALFAGVLLALFFVTYPLIEVTILAFGALSVVAPRLPSVDRGVETDVETAFLATIPAVIGTPKGIATFAVVFSGLAMAAIPLFAVVGVLTLGGRELLIELASGPRGATVAVGLACGVIYGTYGVWYWLAIARRFPTLLRVQNGRSASPTATRPPGVMIPATGVLLYATGTGVVQASVLFYGPYEDLAPLWLVAAIGAGFVVMVGAVSWNVLLTVRRWHPQPAASDERAIPAAIVVQSVGFVVSVLLLSVYDPVTAGGVPAGIETLRSLTPVYGRWLLLLPPVLSLFHADRIARILLDDDDVAARNAIMIAVVSVLIGLAAVVF